MSSCYGGPTATGLYVQTDDSYVCNRFMGASPMQTGLQTVNTLGGGNRRAAGRLGGMHIHGNKYRSGMAMPYHAGSALASRVMHHLGGLMGCAPGGKRMRNF